MLAVAGVVFLGTVGSPPSLLDDVDAAYAQIARTMLESGDWVTARLNGVPYFDKPPGQVWAMALSFAVFGEADWAARLPAALAAMSLCLLAWSVGRWALGARAGLIAGAGLATCCGLFLFTRARMPDVYVACTTLAALACFLRALEDPRAGLRPWGPLAGLCLGAGLLFKGLVGAVLPLGALAAFMAISGQWRSRDSWTRLGLPGAAAAAAIVAGPWHLAAILRHPPHFDLALDSGPGLYRGFFWRYFVNEHLLRYLGTRHPPDFGRVNLAWFWASHLVWLFPWTGLMAGLRRLSFDASERAGRTRLMMACACGFTLAFFSASTTQEYYTLPAYAPAMLLLGSVATDGGQLRRAVRVASTAFLAALALAAGLLAVTGAPAEGGDISSALTSNPDAYTLSLGHFQDLTVGAFAYLRGPLLAATVAFAIAAAAGWLLPPGRAAATLAVSSVSLFLSAHWAMQAFDPYLSSRPLADAYLASPAGTLVLDYEYYAFSSLAFYADRDVLLLNGRRNNIEYGSNAPGAPDVFVSDRDLPGLWASATPVYVATYAADRARIEAAIGGAPAHVIAASGGKVLLSSLRPASSETDDERRGP